MADKDLVTEVRVLIYSLGPLARVKNPLPFRLFYNQLTVVRADIETVSDKIVANVAKQTKVLRG